MPRMLALFTGPWTDLPLDVVAARANEWGYQSLDLACWGEHLAVQRVLAEPDYCRSILSTLEKNQLNLAAISNQAVGQATADVIGDHHRATLPEWVWGAGDAEGVQTRAAQEIIDTARAAQQLGVNLVRTATGSPFSLQHTLTPGYRAEQWENGWQRLSTRWRPILDAFAQAQCSAACDIGPAQTAFDLPTTQATIQALEGHLGYTLAFAPAVLHWQGVDPLEYLRQFSDRISSVLVQDVAVTLTGRTSLLGSLLPDGSPRRGWNYRAPGHGNLDWPAILRTLHQVRYAGPLIVSIQDADMDRDYAAREAVQFIRRLDFEPA